METTVYATDMHIAWMYVLRTPGPHHIPQSGIAFQLGQGAVLLARDDIDSPLYSPIYEL